MLQRVWSFLFMRELRALFTFNLCPTQNRYERCQLLMQTMFHLHFAVKAIVIVILEKSSPLLNRDVSFSHIDQYLTIFMVRT